jgi:sec-independent protein translocase protein TatA
MQMPGGLEWVLIAVVILLLFGAKKIPEFAKGLGQGIREFKKASSEAEKELAAPEEKKEPTGKGS